MADDVKADVISTIERIDLDPIAAEELLPLLYQELRELAGAWLSRERREHTLQPTALVHEVYLRLLGDRPDGWQGRRHFFGAAARAMRRILVEHARRKSRLRHGGGRKREVLDDVMWEGSPPDELLALDEAIADLEREDPRLGQIVNLRYFAGMTTPQAAELLGLSVTTVEREWRYIRRRLHLLLQSGSAEGRSETGPEPDGA